MIQDDPVITLARLAMLSWPAEMNQAVTTVLLPHARALHISCDRTSVGC